MKYIEEPKDIFLETHRLYTKEQRKLARLQYKANRTTPQSLDDRYSLAKYFVEEVTKSPPVWGDLKIKIV